MLLKIEISNLMVFIHIISAAGWVVLSQQRVCCNEDPDLRYVLRVRDTHWCLKLNLKLWVLTVYSYLRPNHDVSLQFFYNMCSGFSGSPELTANYDKWCLVFVNWLTYRHIIIFVWCVLLRSWCKWINQNLIFRLFYYSVQYQAIFINLMWTLNTCFG